MVEKKRNILGNRLWVISEIYYPEEIGTGYYLTGLAEGLSSTFSVNVLCGYPTYDLRGSILPSQEVRNGVHVERCQGTKFNKNKLILRSVNLITVSISLFIKAFFQVQKHDLVLVVTNPPLLPFLIEIVCRFKKAHCVLRLDDVYPEILVATGIVGPHNLVVRFWRFLTKRLYLSVDQIIVVGRDMAKLAQSKVGDQKKQTSFIPNWADIDLVVPIAKKDNQLLIELGLENKFIIQCAGNMGRAQGIENMFGAIRLLREDVDIHFIFTGNGAKKKWMEDEIYKEQLCNVTLLDQRPRSDQPNFLNASDIIMISLIPGMAGAGVPSRMYNAMAAGKPIIAITESESELSLVVAEEEIGWVVHPGQPEKLAEVIKNLKTRPDLLLQMGIRARAVAEEKYAPDKIFGLYCAVFKELI
jgi:colanic acid biosynthesis glycosyl transferase WcaI